MGLQRGGYGNAFDIETESGRPLASDMTTALATSLEKSGFQCVPLLPEPGDAEEAIQVAFRECGAGRLLLLTIFEWKADALYNTALLYDVRMQVIDDALVVRAERRVAGNDKLGGSFWNTPGDTEVVVLEAFAQKLQDLLDNELVTSALGP